MYYFLGYQLLAEHIPLRRKKIRAENTFLLALDGDVDFQPDALQVLVDRMKKSINLGAACGRIHPIGNGTSLVAMLPLSQSYILYKVNPC